jgi:hypothetical protein
MSSIARRFFFRLMPASWPERTSCQREGADWKRDRLYETYGTEKQDIRSARERPSPDSCEAYSQSCARTGTVPAFRPHQWANSRLRCICLAS